MPACGDVAGGANWVIGDVLLLQNCVLFLVFELVRGLKLKNCSLRVFLFFSLSLSTSYLLFILKCFQVLDDVCTASGCGLSVVICHLR